MECQAISSATVVYCKYPSRFRSIYNYMCLVYIANTMALRYIHHFGLKLSLLYCHAYTRKNRLWLIRPSDSTFMVSTDLDMPEPVWSAQTTICWRQFVQHEPQSAGDSMVSTDPANMPTSGRYRLEGGISAGVCRHRADVGPT